MATKETRLLRGRRRGGALVARAVKELREARAAAGLSQVQVASEMGLDPSTIWRLESERRDASITRLSELASVLGYELSVHLHPIGDPVRDRGQLAVGKRFERHLSLAWQVTDETLLPGHGEQRAWDKLLRLIATTPPYLVGVDIETRVVDVQALMRRTRGRERDGRVDAILIVLADSAVNRRLIDELRNGLGDAYQARPREILKALRAGLRLPGSGVVLV